MNAPVIHCMHGKYRESERKRTCGIVAATAIHSGMVSPDYPARSLRIYQMRRRAKGHIFICQLALLLRRVLKMLLKLSGIQMTSRSAPRHVKSVRIVKKTLSGISKSLWQVNQIPEEIQRIFDAVGLELQKLLRNLQLPLPP